jgi:CheY-like chemotaxis protein
MRRILVVDDSGVIRNLAASYLKVFEAELSFASSGTEGWSSFLRLSPDLVLSDIEMPGMSGVELASQIR